MFTLIKRLCSKQISGSGLAAFRVLYGLVLLCEMCQMLYFRRLIFDIVPFIQVNEVDFGPVLLFWIFSLIFLIIGFKTKYVAIINFTLSLLTFSTFQEYEYHLDWTLIGVNFLLPFLPLSTSFSVDRLLLKLKYSSTKTDFEPPKKVAVINYYLPVLLGIGLIYFDSVFWKLASPLWLNGLGFWLPTSLPFTTFLDLTPILNIKYLAYFLGYLTLVFELVFLFLIWFKKFRLPLIIIGIGLHVGILVAYPIPWFALGIISIYSLLIPVRFWSWLKGKTLSNPTLFVYYDEKCPLCNRTRITVSHFDFFNKINFKGAQTNHKSEPSLQHVTLSDLTTTLYSVNIKGKVYSGIETYIQIFKRIWFLWPVGLLISLPGIKQFANYFYQKIAINRNNEACTEDNCSIYNNSDLPRTAGTKLFTNLTTIDLKAFIILVFIIYCLFAQTLYISKSTLAYKAFTALGIEPIRGDNSVLVKNINWWNRRILGIYSHGVFLDLHFKDYNHLIAVVYKDKNGNETWLPLIRKNGQVSYYNTGKQWAKYTWRTNEPHISMTTLNNSLREFTSFWAHKNNISLTDASFIILVKKIDIPTKWEKDFLRNQMDNPWVSGGKVIWKDFQFISEVKDIESI